MVELHEVSIVTGDEVTGLQGRHRIKREQVKGRQKWFDVQREKVQAYEYMCHLQELKEWMESVLGEKISSIGTFEEDLRNGVLLARVIQKFEPSVVKKIHTAQKLEYKHSENVNYVFNGFKKIGLPPTFDFELIDIYDKKNVPKVIFSFHALAHLLHARGLAPRISDLVGKVEFTDEQLTKTQNDLNNLGTSLPAFSGVKDKLKKELQDKNEFHEKGGVSISNARYIHLDMESNFNNKIFVDRAYKLRSLSQAYIAKQQIAEINNSLKNTQLITKLQSLSRNYILRSRLAQIDHIASSKFQEIIKVQAQIRGHLIRSKWVHQLEPLRENFQNVTKLQGHIRGHISLNRYNAIQDYRNNNVDKLSKLQALCRGLNMRIFYNEFILKEHPKLPVVIKFLHLLRENDIDISDDAELDRLRQLLIRLIKENKKTEKDLADLDVKISLLVKNRVTLDEVIKTTGFLNVKRQNFYNKDGEAHSSTVFSANNNGAFSFKNSDKQTRELINNYGYLFYLLQTEPQYLSKILQICKESTGDKTIKIFESIVLNVFGFAQNPREEFLLLKLFKVCINDEVQNCSSIDQFTKGNPAFLQLAVQYNRGTREREYLMDLLQPIVLSIISDDTLDLETDPLFIYRSLIKKEETETGQKSSKSYDVTKEEALSDPNVKATLIDHLKKLRDLTTQLMKAIEDALPKMPYGVRYIAKELRATLLKKYPTEDPNAISKVVAHLVYYRYINPAIVAPDLFGVIDQVINSTQRKNLAEIAKMLNQVSNGKVFGEENIFLHPLNPFILDSSAKFWCYFVEVCNVTEPEEHFGLDEYMDLKTIKKPILYITAREIFSMHSLISDNLQYLAPNKKEHLRVIMEELQSVPEIEDQSVLNQEIKLILNNRFPNVESIFYFNF